MYITKLKPAHVKYIWGGNNLHAKFGKENLESIGETWELSYDEKNPCLINDGEFAGKQLKDIATQEDIGKNSENMPFFPLLIKFIDAKDNLSVQVHPSDDYALKNENQYGKTEMWYILDAGDDAKICYGLKEEIERDQLMDLMKSGEIMDKLNFVNAKKGDVFFVESETIHAIGSGITVYEVQQNSTLTYRLFDYMRQDKDGNYRELHLEKARDVSNLGVMPADKLKKQKPQSIAFDAGSLEKTVLGYSKYFVSIEYKFKGEVTIPASKNTFMAFSCVDGNGEMNGVTFKMGDTIFVPARSEQLQIKGAGTFVMSKVSKFYLGIDVGGTAVKGGLVTDDGDILVKSSVDTQSNLGTEKVISNIIDLCKSLVENSNIEMSEIAGIGMGIPGAIDSKNGIVTYSNNLHWEDVHMKEALEQQLGIEVKMTNDANAAALGEALFGAGNTHNDSVLVTLGTGVGSGIIIDGKLFEGGYSVGAEIGHTVVKRGGELCTCGRKGCFEVYSSATGLIRETKFAMRENSDSKMWETVNGDIDKVDGRTAFLNAKVDKSAKAVVDEYIDTLADGLANIANIFRPGIILLGGGISKEGTNLTDPLQELLNERIFGGSANAPVKVAVASLGNDAGTLGGVGLFTQFD